MPADKLILLCPWLRKSIRKLVKEGGFPIGRYRNFLDLSKTDPSLPVRLSCGGSINNVNKIELNGVAKLGLTRTREIIESICGGTSRVKIYRIDWAVDILDISPSQLAASCRFQGIQSSAFFQSRLGTTYYPHRSKERTVLIYDKLKLLRSRHNPAANGYKQDQQLTRLEVQFRGKGVPIRSFDDIRGYGDIDLLKGMKLVRLRHPPQNAKPQEVLIFEALNGLIDQIGLQNTAKRFSSSQWAYLQKRYFEADAHDEIPDVRRLLTKSARDWLADIIRFPRSKSR